MLFVYCNRFTVSPLKDSIRHVFLDVIVVMVSSVSVGVAIKVAKLNSRPQSRPDSTMSNTPTNGTTMQNHYVKLPKWAVSVLDISLFFLFLLCSVLVPSVLSFWYFFVFLSLAIMWSIHFKRAGLVVRSLRTISLVYTAVHLIVLYLYQFQSFQLAVPSKSFNNLSHLIVR